MSVKISLLFLIISPLSILKGQKGNCDYFNAIIHLQNDPQIREVVCSAFDYRIAEQKFPVSYSVADSLTFIDIGFFLRSEYKECLGLDSSVYNNRNGYKDIYFSENVLLTPFVTNPTDESKPLYLFISKKVGNIIALEIKEEKTYPIRQDLRMGTSVIVVLLIDDEKRKIKTLFVDQVHHN